MELEYLLDSQLVSNLPGFEPYPYPEPCKKTAYDEHLLSKEPELPVKADVPALLKSKSDLVRLLCVVSTLLSLVSPRNVLSHPGVLPCMF